MLDRIDLHVEVTPVRLEDLSSKTSSEKSKEIRERVIAARLIQEKRFIADDIHCNAQMSTKQTTVHCILELASQNLLNTAMKRLGLSARAYERIIRVAFSNQMRKDSRMKYSRDSLVMSSSKSN